MEMTRKWPKATKTCSVEVECKFSSIETWYLCDKEYKSDQKLTRAWYEFLMKDSMQL